jgi:hypothetical protein
VSPQNGGPVAQHGWSVRLIIERSPVQIRLGPPQFVFVFSSSRRRKRLPYSSSTSGLGGGLFFCVCVWFRLLVGCGRSTGCRKRFWVRFARGFIGQALNNGQNLISLSQQSIRFLIVPLAEV